MPKTDMQTTHYIIYKTTNLVNNKTYIGKHITQNLDDGYLGSGKLLKRAIDKYGVENFQKEILHVFDNEADMNDKERELVTEEFVLQETNYNLCVGGKGGFSYINHNSLGITDAQKEAAAHHRRVVWNERKAQLLTDPDWKSAYSKKLSEAGSGRTSPFKGKKHTEESKARMSHSSKGKGSGKTNSQYGTRWITNGSENKKIKKTECIPDGWYAGRYIPV